jgi:hypothetical protein
MAQRQNRYREREYNTATEQGSTDVEGIWLRDRTGTWKENTVLYSRIDDGTAIKILVLLVQLLI